MFSNQGPQTNIGWAMGIFWFQDFDWAPLETLYLISYLSEKTFFYIIWKLVYMDLFWAKDLNFLVDPSWLKIGFKSIF